MIFNPNRFTLEIKFDISIYQYVTEINEQRVIAYSLEQLFDKILKKIGKYENNHILNNSNCEEKKK